MGNGTVYFCRLSGRTWDWSPNSGAGHHRGRSMSGSNVSSTYQGDDEQPCDVEVEGEVSLGHRNRPSDWPLNSVQ